MAALAADDDAGLRDRRLAAFKEEIAARTGELEMSETKRRALEQDLEAAVAARLRSESELRAAEEARRRLEAELQEARAGVERLEAERDEMVRRLAEILTSSSWRMTSPLRRLVRKVRREPEEAEERGPV